MPTIMERALAIIQEPNAYLSTKEWADRMAIPRVRMSSAINAMQAGKSYPKINCELVGNEKYFWIGKKPPPKSALDNWPV